MSKFWELGDSIPWYGWVAIVGIIGGCAVAIVNSIISHRDRMEKIRKGIDEPPRNTETR